VGHGFAREGGFEVGQGFDFGAARGAHGGKE
jgi:hypothetical protein